MSERYWVLRVKGRNRWIETIHTGPKPLAYAAELSEAHGGAVVAVFEALPVGEVTARTFASTQERDEQMAKYEGRPLVFAKPEAPAVPDLGHLHITGAGVTYKECGHYTKLPPDGHFIPNTCPVCNKEREEAVDNAVRGAGPVLPIVSALTGINEQPPRPVDPPRPAVRRDFA